MSTDVSQNVKPLGNHYFNLAIGVVGMIFASCGNLLSGTMAQKWCYLIGGILLLISSALERQPFFSILQTIILSGVVVSFAPIAPHFKVAVPIFLSIVSIIYFTKQGLLRDPLTVVGCIGILFLAAGYAITHPIIYFLGATGLMIYSFGSYRRGVAIGLLWGILNLFFMVTASIAIYNLFFG